MEYMIVIDPKTGIYTNVAIPEPEDDEDDLPIIPPKPVVKKV